LTDRAAAEAGHSFRLAEDIGLAWQSWEGEIIVFNEASGDTHRLDLVASATFEALLEMPGNADHLTRRVAEDLGTEPSAELSAAVLAALGTFRQLGLLA